MRFEHFGNLIWPWMMDVVHAMIHQDAEMLCGRLMYLNVRYQGASLWDTSYTHNETVDSKL